MPPRTRRRSPLDELYWGAVRRFGLFLCLAALGCGGTGYEPFGPPGVQPPDDVRELDHLSDPLLAYVASVGGGLHVVSLNSRARPQLVYTDDTITQAHSLKLASGDLALIADQTDGLQIYDLADPWYPEPYGQTDTFRALDAVSINGRIYVADQTAGLKIVELGPLSAGVTGEMTSAGFALSVDANANVLMVAAQHQGFHTVDTSQPDAPQILATVDTPDIAYDVAIRGTYAYVTDYTAGLIIVDITDPAQPEIVGNVEVPGRAFRVALLGPKAFVAAREGGVSIIDVSAPRTPRLMNVYQTPGQALGVAAAETFLYVADDSAGLMVVHIEPTQGIPLLRARMHVEGTARDIMLVEPAN